MVHQRDGGRSVHEMRHRPQRGRPRVSLDFASRSLSQSLRLTDGLGAAYTPTVIGVDGTAYIIANATLFAVGQ